MTDPTLTEDTATVLSRIALDSANIHHTDITQNAVQKLADGHRLLWAIGAWADTAATAAARRAGYDIRDHPPHTVIPRFTAPDGTHTPIDNEPPATVWAMRIIAARIARDHDTFFALTEAMPEHCGDHIAAVLRICNHMINTADTRTFTPHPTPTP